MSYHRNVHPDLALDVRAGANGGKMKLCKDCRWSKKPWFASLQCEHPVIGPRPELIDPVTGEKKGGGFWICDVNRSFSDDPCGRDGKLWEKRT